MSYEKRILVSSVELFAIEIALDVYNDFYIHEEFLNFWTLKYM